VLSVFHITLSKNHFRWHTPPAWVMRARDTFSTYRVLRPTFAHLRHFLRVPRTNSGGHFTAVFPQGFFERRLQFLVSARILFTVLENRYSRFSHFFRVWLFSPVRLRSSPHFPDARDSYHFALCDIRI
jgi:hypothetical protein